jgi:peptidoglycan/LPS O-acetylase OafA/YrhL
MKFLVLDSFRGICAILVVLFHIRVLGSITEISFVRQSYYFVEFFFVLSGFVIAHSSIYKNSYNFSSFITRRIFRIFPLHLFMLIGFLIYELLKYQTFLNGRNFETIFFNELAILNTIFLNITLVMTWFNTYSINGPAWSISVEFAMYIIFAVMLSFTSSKKYTSLLTIFLFLLGSLLLIKGFGGDDNKLFRGLSSFFGGILTYTLFIKYKHIFEIKKNSIFTLLEVCLITILIFLISIRFEQKFVPSIILFMMIVFVFSFEKGKLSVFFKKSIFQYLGKLSYSIYITHYLILNFFVTLIILFQGNNYFTFIGKDDWRHVDFNHIVLNYLYIFSVVSLVLLFSKYTFKYIEMPFNNLGKRLTARDS